MNTHDLHAQAQKLGIALGHYDINGQYHIPKNDVLNQLIQSFESESSELELAKIAQWRDIWVKTVGETILVLPNTISLDKPLILIDENQSQTILSLHQENAQTWAILPNDLAMGYYSLAQTDELPILLIIAPQHAYQPENSLKSKQYHGLAVQLYALKSERNWGVGDFTDLANLAPICAEQNIDFIGINPLHALYTSRPDFASPYSPSSRRWLNPIYLDVERVTFDLNSKILKTWLSENQNILRDLRERETVDYVAVWAKKHEALKLIFQSFQIHHTKKDSEQHRAFQQFKQEHGEDLAGFALFEVLDHYFQEVTPKSSDHSHHQAIGWLAWDKDFHDKNSISVQQFKHHHDQEIEFFMWLQWLCAVQWDFVRQAMSQYHLKLGVYGDLAVGVAQGSADTWLKRDQYCLDLAIGAPPDPFSPIGQNWQLPPYNPQTMWRTGCAEFIKIIRENMKLYGILRIDHVMALNRLWLITGQNESAENGAYVHYPQQILFAIVALESHINQCVVIGEDLGTVPDETRELLQRYQIFSYKVQYFHKDTENYPRHSIAVTSTHDLAPLAGYWLGEDLREMRKLGTLPTDAHFQAACEQRERDKTQIIQKLKLAHFLPQDFSQPETLTPELLSAIHAWGTDNRAQLFALQLENLLGMTQNFNIPSVASGNWVQKYPISLENLPKNQIFNQQFQLIQELRMHTAYPTPNEQERNTINALIHAEHGDVFAYLGRHTVDGVGDVVRALLPHAQAVSVLARDTQAIVTKMKKVDERGLWACRLPENTADYILQITENNQIFTQEDPYRFGSFLGDTDNWLLGEGKHLRPYEKLGAHLREINGIQGAYFAIWAPNAQRVSVIGEFNHWDGRVHVMRRHHDTGVWEIFIPNVKFNALYKFELRDKHGNIRVKSDPYAFAAELRPTTASVLRGLPEKMPVPAFRQKANAVDAPISIYEVHLGSWRRKADNAWLTYTELAEQLIDYVKEMGFTHIELLPISEFPFDGSWGYQATGLYAPTSRFGSPQELQFLVQKAHDAGISVILDWVVGHFPTDEHGLAKFDGTALYEHEDPREGFHQDWNTLIYNFGRHEVRNFLSGNALYWVEHFGFDGLRVDAVASMIYRDYSRKDGEWIPNQFGGRDNLEAIDFLRETNAMLQEQNLHVTGIAEESTAFPNVTKAEGLNFQFKWNMGWMNDTLRYMKEDPINRKYHHNLMTFGMMYQYSENYILPLSHDEVVHGKCSLLGKMPGDCWQKFANLRAYYGFMYGYPGKKLLFMGNEFGQGREWDFSGSLDWHLLEEEHGGGWHKGVQDFVKKLNYVYQEFAPLYQLDQWQDGFEWLVADDGNRSVFVFERKDREGNRLIVISNFTPVVREDYRFGVNVAGEYRVILNSDDDVYKGSEIQLSGSLKTENIESHGKKHSLSLTLPPLATVYLYCPAPKMQAETAPPKPQSISKAKKKRK